MSFGSPSLLISGGTGVSGFRGGGLQSDYAPCCQSTVCWTQGGPFIAAISLAQSLLGDEGLVSTAN